MRMFARHAVGANAPKPDARLAAGCFEKSRRGLRTLAEPSFRNGEDHVRSRVESDPVAEKLSYAVKWFADFYFNQKKRSASSSEYVRSAASQHGCFGFNGETFVFQILGELVSQGLLAFRPVGTPCGFCVGSERDVPRFEDTSHSHFGHGEAVCDDARSAFRKIKCANCILASLRGLMHRRTQLKPNLVPPENVVNGLRGTPALFGASNSRAVTKDVA